MATSLGVTLLCAELAAAPGPQPGTEEAGGWDRLGLMEALSSAGTSLKAVLAQQEQGLLCVPGQTRAFPSAGRAQLFNSLKLLLLFPLNRNANMSAFLGGFIKYPAHHSEPHNSCQVPTSPSLLIAEPEFL